ncbi:hypothetical protein HOY80DRAFT_525270 [Tuber brumale]|nr:hypothetical protein HOY80DRAFT_525270 [Tuber brumale]
MPSHSQNPPHVSPLGAKTTLTTATPFHIPRSSAAPSPPLLGLPYPAPLCTTNAMQYRITGWTSSHFIQFFSAGRSGHSRPNTQVLGYLYRLILMIPALPHTAEHMHHSHARYGTSHSETAGGWIDTGVRVSLYSLLLPLLVSYLLFYGTGSGLAWLGLRPGGFHRKPRPPRSVDASRPTSWSSVARGIPSDGIGTSWVAS